MRRLAQLDDVLETLRIEREVARLRRIAYALDPRVDTWARYRRELIAEVYRLQDRRAQLLNDLRMQRMAA